MSRVSVKGNDVGFFFVTVGGTVDADPRRYDWSGKILEKEYIGLYLKIGRIWWLTDFIVPMNHVGELQLPKLYPELKWDQEYAPLLCILGCF